MNRQDIEFPYYVCVSFCVCMYVYTIRYAYLSQILLMMEPVIMYTSQNVLYCVLLLITCFNASTNQLYFSGNVIYNVQHSVYNKITLPCYTSLGWPIPYMVSIGIQCYISIGWPLPYMVILVLGGQYHIWSQLGYNVILVLDGLYHIWSQSGYNVILVLGGPYHIWSQSGYNVILVLGGPYHI